MLPFFSSSFPIRNLVLGVLILYILISSYHLTKTWQRRAQAELLSDRNVCAASPFPANLVLSVKTGATEAFEKLPTQLLTNLRCTHNPLIFSDLSQHLGPHHLIDVLDTLPSSVTTNNPDFDIYRKQQHYQATNRDIRLLSTEPDVRADWRTAGHNAAWALDKYKFLPMLLRAWAAQPERDWYLFVESDTYISWANLQRLLDAFDPSTPLYLGNPTRMHAEIPERPFHMAHGGSGILLSGAAMRAFAAAFTKPEVAAKWHSRVKDMWYGDFVLAAFLDEELDLQITPAWPLVARETPLTAAYGAETWCMPVVTLHHMRPEEVSAMWKFEQARWDAGKRTPLLRKDLWNHFIEGEHLEARRGDWDNLSGERRFAVPLPPSANASATEPDPVTSAAACEQACEKREGCLQYSFITVNTTDEGTCWLSRVVRLGEAKAPEFVHDRKEIRAWQSGWMRDRIRWWIGQQSCRGVPPIWKGELPPG